MAKGKFDQWLTQEGLSTIRSWRRHGLTDDEVAKKMGIARSTLWTWAERFPDILDAIKKGREERVAVIEDSLEDCAVGYYRDEVTLERIYNRKTGEFEMVETKRVKKWVAPTPAVQIFALKNLAPDQWKDHPEPTQDQALQVAVEILGDIGGAIK